MQGVLGLSTRTIKEIQIIKKPQLRLFYKYSVIKIFRLIYIEKRR